MTSSSRSARGLRGQRAHDGHALLLAAGEPVRVPVLVAAQPEPGQQLAGALLGLGARHAVRPHGGERDVLQDGQVGEEVEGLEDHAEAAADGDGVDRRVRDDLAVDQHVAVVDLLQQVDAAQERRLARAGRADERDGAVLLHREVDAPQHRHVAVRLGDAAQLEHASPRGPPALQDVDQRASGTVTHR